MTEAAVQAFLFISSVWTDPGASCTSTPHPLWFVPLCFTVHQSLTSTIACGSDCKLLHANSKECSAGRWKIKDGWSTGVYTDLRGNVTGDDTFKAKLVAAQSFTLNRLYRRSSTEQKSTCSSIPEPPVETITKSFESVMTWSLVF